MCIRDRHDSYRDVKGGEFFVSSDKLNWTAVGAFEAQKVLEEHPDSIPIRCNYTHSIGIIQDVRYLVLSPTMIFP